MRCRVGHKGVHARLRGLCGAPAQTEPQSRSSARAPCPRVRPALTHSIDAWARRHARAFVTSTLRAGAFAHPTNDRIRPKPALADYFRVPSVAHYLIVDPETPRVAHHARGSGET